MGSDDLLPGMRSPWPTSMCTKGDSPLAVPCSLLCLSKSPFAALLSALRCSLPFGYMIYLANNKYLHCIDCASVCLCACGLWRLAARSIDLILLAEEGIVQMVCWPRLVDWWPVLGAVLVRRASLRLTTSPGERERAQLRPRLQQLLDRHLSSSQLVEAWEQ